MVTQVHKFFNLGLLFTTFSNLIKSDYLWTVGLSSSSLKFNVFSPVD